MFVYWFLGPDDYTAGPYEITFSAGDTFMLMGCAMIPTADDDILEGDHEFSVGVGAISPDGAVTVTGPNAVVTITDDDGRHMLHIFMVVT